MTLGEFVRNYRLDEAITQEEFANKVKLTNVTISQIENGKEVGSKALKNLSKYFGVSTKELRKMMLEKKGE